VKTAGAEDLSIEEVEQFDATREQVTAGPGDPKQESNRRHRCST
jgi:hypothetical protein